MDRNLNRRDFSKLTAAAFGGVVAGMSSSAFAADEKKDHDPELLLKEPHVCRGLNTCKGKESKEHGADNACAGQGHCATAKHHECKGENECKGQGGCGEFAGQNTCKGKGGCAVPVSCGTPKEEHKVWKSARKEFEKQMKKADKKFGDAPPLPKKKES